MLSIKSPDSYRQGSSSKPKVFIAGGITGCPDWQAKFEELCVDLDILLFNPRRDGLYDTLQPEWGEEQIEWEHYHLSQADHIVFWFPKEGMCMITLFELGKCLGQGKSVVVGCEEGYLRKFDVVKQVSLLKQPNVVSSLSILKSRLELLI